MIKFTIETKDILEACKKEEEAVKKQLIKSLGTLSKAAVKHIFELADKELSPNLRQIFRGKESQQNIYLDAISPNVHVITLTGSAYWIEEGIPKNTDMKTSQWLFSSKKTKMGKNGRYLVIPFEHSKAPSLQTGYEQNLRDRVKFELKAVNERRKANGLSSIPWKGIETDKSWKPKEGLLHEFSFKGGKAKSSWSSDPLDRMRIYQAIERDKENKIKKTKSGKAKVSRSFMTFRTASESAIRNPNTGVSPKEKFIYPGYDAKKFMDKTRDWVEEEFYNKILPAIFKEYKDE
jgi:hypothetical protein